MMKLKRGRTIIFSTHHLDEAKELSDKVMIMKSGEKIEFDSPLNIINKHSSGYKMTINIDKESEE